MSAPYLAKESGDCNRAFGIAAVGHRLQNDESDATQKSEEEVKSGVSSESDSRILLDELDVIGRIGLHSR